RAVAWAGAINEMSKLQRADILICATTGSARTRGFQRLQRRLPRLIRSRLLCGWRRGRYHAQGDILLELGRNYSSCSPVVREAFALIHDTCFWVKPFDLKCSCGQFQSEIANSICDRYRRVFLRKVNW